MKKYITFQFNLKPNWDLYLMLFFSCFTILTPLTASSNSVNIKVESFENVIDFENEVKEQKIFENQVQEDHIAQKINRLDRISKKKCIITNLSIDLLLGLYFRIPTPPPEMF